MQEEQCYFHPGCGKLDQRFILLRIFHGLWELFQPLHMCFVDLEKSIQPRSMGYCVSCALGLGMFALLVGAIQSLYNHCESFVHITRHKSDSFTVEVRLNQGWSLFIIFIDRISRQSPLEVPRMASLFLQMMWFCWHNQVVSFSLY